jgi:hypothetical protein
MVRTIAAVVVGYLVMALLVFALFSAAYLAMGADAAFRPGTFEVSGLWVATSFVLGLVAAVVGGYVCATIAQDGKGPLILAALTLLLGVLVAVPLLTSDAGQPQVRSGDVPNLAAMQQARQPGWVALLNPLVGAAGVLAGARLKRERPA